MADDFDIRAVALSAAIDLLETGAPTDEVIAVAEKFLPFLNGGVPDHPAPVQFPTPSLEEPADVSGVPAQTAPASDDTDPNVPLPAAA